MTHYSFMELPRVQAVPVEDVLKNSSEYNAHLMIYNDTSTLVTSLGPQINAITSHLSSASKTDASFNKNVNVLYPTTSNQPPIITASTGDLRSDYDDVRKYQEAAVKAIKRAKSAKWTKPLFIIQAPPADLPLSADFANYAEVALLGALGECYEMLQARETSKDDLNVIEEIGVCIVGGSETVLSQSTIDQVCAIESGRRLTRDIGGADPERMTALKTAETIENYFRSFNNLVKVSVMQDQAELAKNYPLLMAVARGSEPVPRHAPCVITLTYKSKDQSLVEEELFMVGKGVTYDTGGMDVKVGGNMVGMSRDKCGAAALAGFMATVAHLNPLNLNVTIKLAMVRNSIGSNGYVPDELLTARSGVRVRVGNTDAEGRMAMADVLCECKELALANGRLPQSRLFTCATLTGHARMAVGSYPIAMDNVPAAKANIARSLFEVGHANGDPFEVSVVRRDDFKVIEPKHSGYDLEQIVFGGNRGIRGHQYPGAFLQVVSGLDKCGLNSTTPLAYTHMDINGITEEGDSLRPSASPIISLAARFIRRLP